MNAIEHTTLALVCMAAAYVWGRAIGLKAGIVATLEHLEDEGVIKFKREDEDE